MDANAFLSRLRSDEGKRLLSALSALLVDEGLSRPLPQVIPPAWLARAVVAGTRGWLASASSTTAQRLAFAALRQRADADSRLWANVLPGEFQDAVHRLLQLPLSPSREAVEALVSAPPVREWLTEVLQEVLAEFGQRLKSPLSESNVARSLAGFAQQAKSRTGALGALAGGVFGAVSSEVDKQLERRMSEGVALAVEEVLGRVVEALSSPTQAEKLLALKAAWWEQFLGTSVSQLSKETKALDEEAVFGIVREALSAWVERPDAEATLGRFFEDVLPPVSLGDFLQTHGLREPFVELAAGFLESQLQPLVQSEAFGQWLAQAMR